jgi:uncharacterized membrane protein YdjX (TVP38/TMEM64 family)
MTASNSDQSTSALRRWLPLVVLLAGVALVLGMGWHKHLSFKTVGLNYEALRSFVEANLAVALVMYTLIYIAVVAMSLPGGLVMTLSGGLLFGWKLGGLATLIGATIGASIIFLIAKTSFGEPLAAKAGPWLGKLRDGFKENALSYLLFLRLVPAFPFVVVNLAPALLGVPLRIFVLGTFLGIIPGTLAFSMAGAGLGSVIEAQNRIYRACLAAQPANLDAACPYTIDTSELVTRELLLAFVLLGVIALIPVAVKKWCRRHAEA